MKLTDPCGFCGKTLRPGDNFHEVVVPVDHPSGREPGKYNSVCGDCAGEALQTPFPAGADPVHPGLDISSNKAVKDKTQRCGLCKRAMRKGTAYQRLRTEDVDGFSFETGLHAMCQSCYNKYKDVVHARTGGADF